MKSPSRKSPLPNAALLYLSVGSGHQIAAEAISSALLTEEPQMISMPMDPFSEVIDILPSIIERLQAASIALTPGIYDRLWRQGASDIIDVVKDIRILQRIMEDSLPDSDRNIIIATHVLPCAIALSLKRTKVVNQVYGVLTDFGAHALWPISDELDGYFVPHDEIRNLLIYRGFAPHKIVVSGIPIKLDFQNLNAIVEKPIEEKIKLLMIVGGIRSGAYIEVQQSITEILEALNSLGPAKFELTIIVGYQDRLQRKINELANQLHFGVRVFGFVNNMSEVMSQNDIVITKPGGLITSESLAAGLCMILLKAGPGQESVNADFLARHGVAFRGETPEDIRENLDYLIKNPHVIMEMKQCAASLGKSFASKTIAQHVLENF